MEEKRTASTAAGSPTLSEPASSRRRAAALKRKSNAFPALSPAPTPSKRLNRDKSAAIFYPPVHNGPLTRARQSPNSFAVSAQEEKRDATADVSAASAEEEERSKVEELEADIEAEYEAIRSRDSNAHVVPSHCGWFSWSKVHPLEECLLPSFFGGKSHTRTPDTYMEIRNWIVKKFHANPNTLIELKDLSELEVVDLEARQEVLEFLDYWGLINFHPFPETDSVVYDDGDGTAEKDSLLENLFHFEETQKSPTVSLKPSLTPPAVPLGLFPDSAIYEELVWPEEPSVEYHCNSCSSDCSRKRYHCPKQVDYDLCAECFNNGKFGSDISPSDFILMEPAEAAGLGGGNWTDQETLLLLEALELFKENWNDIAEHVATKTKAQCMLHFVQMPIEDVFFDSDDDVDVSSKDPTNPTATVDEVSAAKNVPETREAKTDGKEDQTLTSSVGNSKPEKSGEVKACMETIQPDSIGEVMVNQEKSKSEDSSEKKINQGTSDNIALDALTEAFEAFGYFLTPENRLSFAEVGNPVMALAAFLSRLVGPEVASASARSSLKSLTSSSPGTQLAARHCFLLEDPSNDYESNKKIEDSIPGEKKQVDSSKGSVNEKLNTENKAGAFVTPVEAEPGKRTNDSELPKDCAPSTITEPNEKQSKPECPLSSIMEQQGSSVGESSQIIDVAKDLDAISDEKASKKNEPNQSATPMSIDESSLIVEASKDVDMVSKGVDKLSSEPPEKVKLGYPAENGPTSDGDQKNSNTGKPDHKEVNDNQNINKLKRAAVATLSAAVVKAKLVANQEENQIQQLAAFLIEKQLRKLEMKLAFFDDMAGVIMRVKEQLDRTRQRLYHERAQIIAARFGLPASSSRNMPPSLPNMMATNFANSVARPPMSMASQRPPIPRSMGPMPPRPF